MLWMLVGTLDEDSQGMDRFQLTVRRENCPAPMLPCAPVQYGRYLTRDSGEGSKNDQFPDCAALSCPVIGASFPTRPARGVPSNFSSVSFAARSPYLVVEH